MTNSEKLQIYKLKLKNEKLKFMLQRLNNKIDLLLQDIDRKNELLKVINNETLKNKLNSEITKSKQELNRTQLKSGRLDIIIKKQEIKIKILNADKLLKNDEIALVNNLGTLEGKYNIYKVSDENKVGFISFDDKSYDSEIGSIGYNIRPQFRGNNYAYKALCLLTNYLSDNGIEKVSLVASLDNKPSISVMERFKENAIVEDQTNNKKTIRRYSYTLNKDND